MLPKAFALSRASPDMNRRTLLATVGAGCISMTSGCLGYNPLADDVDIPDPDDDEFPPQVNGYVRGKSGTFVGAPAKRRTHVYERDSDLCGANAMGSVSEHVHDELEDIIGHPRHLRTSWGRELAGVEITPVRVRFIIRYYRNGTLISESEAGFEEVVDRIPPTAYLTDEEGELVCYTPVYATKVEEGGIVLD